VADEGTIANALNADLQFANCESYTDNAYSLSREWRESGSPPPQQVEPQCPKEEIDLMLVPISPRWPSNDPWKNLPLGPSHAPQHPFDHYRQHESILPLFLAERFQVALGSTASLPVAIANPNNDCRCKQPSI
jgi:hypothetical protein